MILLLFVQRILQKQTELLALPRYQTAVRSYIGSSDRHCYRKMGRQRSSKICVPRSQFHIQRNKRQGNNDNHASLI
jgi:hypothetical protein